MAHLSPDGAGDAVAGPAGTGPGGGEQWLTRGVAGIGGASFLADVGHEIPTALLPSLLTSTLGARRPRSG